MHYFNQVSVSTKPKVFDVIFLLQYCIIKSVFFNHTVLNAPQRCDSRLIFIVKTSQGAFDIAS